MLISASHFLDLPAFYDSNNELKSLIQNYSLLHRDLSNCTWICYTDLMRLVDMIPNDFFSKFFNIQLVEITDKFNSDHLNYFLTQLPHLRTLFLRGSASPDQSFLGNYFQFRNLISQNLYSNYA